MSLEEIISFLYKCVDTLGSVTLAVSLMMSPLALAKFVAVRHKKRGT